MLFKSESSAIRDYRKTFYILCVFFVFFFYILPLVAVVYYPNFDGVYDIVVTGDKVWRAVFCLGIFVIGFVFLDILLLCQSRCLNEAFARNLTLTLVGWLILSCYLFYLFVLTLDSGRTASIYESRQAGGGSWLFLAVQLIANAVKMAVIFLLLNARRVFLALVVITLSFFVEIYSAAGRVNILINVVLASLILSRFKPSTFSFCLFFVAFLFLPLLLNLKNIMYSFSMEGDYTIRPEYLSFDPVAFINNFGHPLISIFEVEGLIDILGYRFFYDYAQGVLFYFKLFGVDYFGASITYANTENLLGLNESIVPPGYMAFGFLQFGYVGVFFSGFFYRLLGFLGEYIVKKGRIYSNCGVFFIAFLAANTFYHGDVRIMVMTLFLVYLVIFCLMSFQKGMRFESQ